MLAACWLAVVTAVAACGGDSGGDGGATTKVDMAAELKKRATITVWSWAPGTEDAVRMFEQAHPHITVKLQNVGGGSAHYQKLRTVIRSGKGLPDVVQMEFQYIPSFTLTESLLDLKPYLPSDFLSAYPEWIRNQVNLDGAIYGVPWDTGPLGLIYRRDLLAKAGIDTPIETWADFAAAAERYRKANPDSYLVNVSGTQTTLWLALFWQAGARPFTSDPNAFKVDLTDPKIERVTEFWDKLYAGGWISHDPEFTDGWYQGFAKGRYAGWISAAWGPIFLQSFTRSSKGQWQAQALPQWEEGEHSSANWGGSTLAVVKGSENPAAAAEFARWILLEKRPVEMFAYDRFMFPPQNFMLENAEWLNKPYEFYGGQAVNTVYADMAKAVEKDWEWPPILEYVATQGAAITGKFVDRGEGATAALQPWQEAIIGYAKQQGLTVDGQ
jgi:multiple sugar transport system substrate-binding protein